MKENSLADIYTWKNTYEIEQGYLFTSFVETNLKSSPQLQQ